MISHLRLSSILALALLLGGLADVVFAAVERETIATAAPQFVLDPQGFLSAVSSVAFSPNGQWLAACGDKEVRLWDVASGRLVHTLRGQRGRYAYGSCAAVAFSPSGQELLVGIDDYSGSGSIRVYDVANLTDPKELLKDLPAPVSYLAFSRDGKTLAAAGLDGQLVVWDWPTRRVVASRLAGKEYFQSIFCFPGSAPEIVAVRGGKLTVFSPTSGDAIPTSSASPSTRRWCDRFERLELPYRSRRGSATLRLDDNLWLLAGAGGDESGAKYWVGVFRGEAAAPEAIYDGHRYLVSAIALSTSGDLAASTDQFGEIHVWNTRTGKAQHVLRALGRPIYEASFGATGRQLAFGQTPYQGERWQYNNYGQFEKVFDLENRTFQSIPGGSRQNKFDSLGARRLVPFKEPNGFKLQLQENGATVSQYTLRTGVKPTAFAFLKSPQLGLESPVILGDDQGSLLCLDLARGWERRMFNGHATFVTAIAQSADGRFLATSSTDRTLRIWALDAYRPTGEVDFRRLGEKVSLVPAGSAAERAGVKVGDRILSLGGYDLTALEGLLATGNNPFRPGERIEAKLEREGKPFTVELPLHEGPDFAEPLVSIFIVDENQWVMWTPQGYYDASPGADRLIGWNVDRGPEKAADFFFAEQFRRQFYRPDVIDGVLRTGSLTEGVAEANRERNRKERPLDLRQREDLEQVRPPRVSIRGPEAEQRFKSPTVTVQLAVEKPEKGSVREIVLLLNGRPAATRKVSEQDFAAGKLEFSQAITLVPGRNELAAVATTANSSSQPQPRAVYFEADVAPPKVRPDLYLFAVGISEYAKKDFNLQFARRDAEQFVKSIAAQKGNLYGDVHTRLLVDAEATKEKIEDGMDWLQRSATARDLAVLFVSAHGVRDQNQDYYLATHAVDPDRLRSTGVPVVEFNRLLQNMPCRVIVFADTCHSGGITGAKAIARMGDPLREMAAAEVGAIVFASSMPREESLEHSDWQNGAFTRALLDTLREPKSDRDAPPDGLLSLSEVDFNLTRRVKELTQGKQHPVMQRPPTISEFNVFSLLK